LKTFGSFLLVLIVVVVIVGIVGVISYTHEMAPTWAEIAKQQADLDIAIAKQNAQADIANHTSVSMAISAGSWVLVLLLLAGGVVWFVWKPMDEREESWNRAVDGMFPTRTIKKNGRTIVIDNNKSIFGASGYDENSGHFLTDEQLVGPDRQLEYVRDVQRTRNIAAKAPDGRKPSRNELLEENGYFRNKSRVEDAKAKLAEHRLLAYETPSNDDGDMKASPGIWQPLTLVDAFRQSTPDRWLLGQNDEGVCEFSIRDNIHTGLLGATGTGKTASTALLMAYDALRSGMHVIALDGKGGVDWTQHERYLEAWPTDYTMIPDQITEIVRLHDLRMKEIKRARVESISQLDYQIPPLFVIMEEFGYTMQALNAASKKRHDQTENALSNLMRVSRATGIHFLLIDQSAKNWPGTIKANVKAWFAYQLKGLQGNAFNAYDLHTLKPKGQFWHNDNVYNAWFTKSEAKTLQQELRPIRTKLLTNVEYNTDDSATDKGGESVSEMHPPAIDNGATITPENDSGDSGDSAINSARLVGKPLSKREKDLVIAEYMLQGSINKTCENLWGAWTVSRGKWVKELLQERGIK